MKVIVLMRDSCVIHDENISRRDFSYELLLVHSYLVLTYNLRGKMRHTFMFIFA